jgi:ubiquinone/menaquinone biosynthesis C-methylase UbiE
MHNALRSGHRNLPTVFEGRPSRVYDVLARRVLRVVYRRVAADVAGTAPKDAAVLDVGTGPGVLMVELAARRPDLNLTGVDLSPSMVAAATRNLAAEGVSDAVCVVADVAELPFPDQSFDLVVSSLSLHHWDRVDAAVPELARVLRPGGRVVIYDLPFAPFGELDATARREDRFSGTAPQRARIPIGLPLLRYTRYALWT